jgi:hypothetical protein
VSVSRRALLRGGVLTLGVDPGGPLHRLWRRVPDGVGRLVGEAHAEPPPSGLSESEQEDLIAFAEVLVEGRTLSPVARAALSENVADRVARERDSLDLYRTTVRLLRRLAGRRFASLEVAERIELMTRHRLNSPDVRPGEALGPFAEEARLVRTRALRDLIADCYNSPAGWAVVGSEVFPGRCGDLLRYTRPET